MSDNIILLSTLILYILGLCIANKYDKFYLVFTSILFFVPIYIINQPIINIFSIIMFIIHIVIPLGSGGNNFD